VKTGAHEFFAPIARRPQAGNVNPEWVSRIGVAHEVNPLRRARCRASDLGRRDELREHTAVEELTLMSGGYDEVPIATKR
jgi:hypothetical protein